MLVIYERVIESFKHSSKLYIHLGCSIYANTFYESNFGFELVGVKMKHGLYLFIAATSHSKNQQTINQLTVLCQKQALISKKVFVKKTEKKKKKRKNAFLQLYL